MQINYANTTRNSANPCDWHVSGLRASLFAISLALTLATPSCGDTMPSISKLDATIKRLRDPKLNIRESAGAELENLAKKGLSVEEGKKALAAAVEAFPPREYDFVDSAAELIEAAAARPRLEYVSVISDLFSRYSDKARVEALGLLSALPHRQAALAYMKLVRDHSKTNGISSLPVHHLREKPRHADVFFPELLDFVTNTNLTWDILHLCLTYCEHTLIASDQLAGHARKVIDVYGSHRDRLVPAQRETGVDWMWEDHYQESRNLASLILDLFGFFPATSIQSELRRALEFRDPRLKKFVVTSLLRLGFTVDQKHLEDVAASAEMRNRLYKELEKLNKLSLFPAIFRNQKAFAESDMVNWLVFPTELGRVPDDIELMKIVSIDTTTEDGILDYYVFRFRTHPPHGAAKDGWMAGVSGPFLRKESPSTKAYGETFSSFEPWDKKTAEGHVGDVREILKRWREHHKKR